MLSAVARSKSPAVGALRRLGDAAGPFLLCRLGQTSGVQPEKACDKEDDNDDADDVENVHGVLLLRQARFRRESAALQQETCRPATKFRSPRLELRKLPPLRLYILRRLVKMDVLVDMVDPSHGNEVVLPIGSIALSHLILSLPSR
jgi:hypothetical protein